MTNTLSYLHLLQLQSNLLISTQLNENSLKCSATLGTLLPITKVTRLPNEYVCFEGCSSKNNLATKMDCLKCTKTGLNKWKKFCAEYYAFDMK